MAQVIPKLNLNKTPALVENNSLIFAKNIRLDVDGTIHRDYGILPMSLQEDSTTKELVDHKDIFSRIINDIDNNYSEWNYTDDEYLNIVVRLNYIIGLTDADIDGNIITKHSCRIVGTIPNSNEFYLFLHGTYDTEKDDKTTTNYVSYIIRYDEAEDLFQPCNCNWSYSGGTITGCVINNLLGEKILNIGESNTNTNIPLKCINLNKSTLYDDESIYTQTPNIPITNVDYAGEFNYVIPNGVYQFFVRYKIRENFYTDWFPASRELFAGNDNRKDTSFGTVKYVNTHRDASKSFKLNIDHLYSEYYSNYKSIQIGFILSHDDEIVARAWKHFDFTITDINFDYNARDAYEIEVTDLLKHTYQLYDVGNITSFKNKLYISNYLETDFNDKTLQDVANKIEITVQSEQGKDGYAGYEVDYSQIHGEKVIDGLIIPINGENKHISFYDNAETSITRELIKDAKNKINAYNLIYDALLDKQNNTGSINANLYGISCNTNREGLEICKTDFRSTHENTENVKYIGYEFVSGIYSITVDGTSIKIPEGVDFEKGNKWTEQLRDNIVNEICGKNRYLNKTGNFIDKKGDAANTAVIEITRACKVTTRSWFDNDIKPPIFELVPADDAQTYALKDPEDVTGSESGKPHDSTHKEYYTQTIKVTFRGNASKLSFGQSDELLTYTTLIPYQQYKFYIHFVKQNGETTNGYYCGGEKAGIIEAPYKEKADCVIYPIFNNVTIPNGYVACFFSISHIKNNVATVFNTSKLNSTGDADPNGIYFEGKCFDLDTSLIPGIDNLRVRQINGNNEDIDVKGFTYYHSSDSSEPRYFGADGYLFINTMSNDNAKSLHTSRLSYFINEYSIAESDTIQLIKCTPYIKEIDEAGFGVYTNMNLLGYICRIYPLNKERTVNYFTDGSSVYHKSSEINTSSDGSESDGFHLTELKNHLGDVNPNNPDDKPLTEINLTVSRAEFIYSNYNLNYLVLSEDPVESYKTYYTGSSENVSNDTKESGGKTLVLRLFKSLTMSMIYELPSMYRVYTRKMYSTYNTNDLTRFDNTVRSSKLEGDEVSINIFKFDANDYYNIPTNRGIIVNLVSIGDSILVHTKDSMFRFSGSNTLQSSDGEIQPSETNVFDTGVSEVFGSDFGFAGLQSKTDSIITETGYIFFDRDSRIVYSYAGQGQIVRISETIEKLFRHKDISNIYFANDYYNNRFFLSIMFTDNGVTYPVTLSFNTNEHIKSFVSLHDFYYLRAFNTKTKCYFITNNKDDICVINKKHKGCYVKLELEDDKTYPSKKERSSLEIKGGYLPINIYDSIIDVINNSNFETIKTLNAVNWSSNIIETEFKEIDFSDSTTTKMAEDTNTTLPCKNLRIYTDSCMTQLFDFSKRSNDYSINSTDSYKYPRFNQGYWTFNYFRNIQNAKGNVSPYVSDQNSLIEGRYFVTRFTFDNEFKFEAITLNYTNKYE